MEEGWVGGPGPIHHGVGRQAVLRRSGPWWSREPRPARAGRSGPRTRAAVLEERRIPAKRLMTRPSRARSSGAAGRVPTHCAKTPPLWMSATTIWEPSPWCAMGMLTRSRSRLITLRTSRPFGNHQAPRSRSRAPWTSARRSPAASASSLVLTWTRAPCPGDHLGACVGVGLEQQGFMSTWEQDDRWACTIWARPISRPSGVTPALCSCSGPCRGPARLGSRRPGAGLRQSSSFRHRFGTEHAEQACGSWQGQADPGVIVSLFFFFWHPRQLAPVDAGKSARSSSKSVSADPSNVLLAGVFFEAAGPGPGLAALQSAPRRRSQRWPTPPQVSKQPP